MNLADYDEQLIHKFIEDDFESVGWKRFREDKEVMYKMKFYLCFGYGFIEIKNSEE
jgi:hypothetical protein